MINQRHLADSFCYNLDICLFSLLDLEEEENEIDNDNPNISKPEIALKSEKPENDIEENSNISESQNILKSEQSEEKIIEKQTLDFTCKICSKDFAGPLTLKIHQRIHKDEISTQNLTEEVNLKSTDETKITKQTEALEKDKILENQHVSLPLFNLFSQVDNIEKVQPKKKQISLLKKDIKNQVLSSNISNDKDQSSIQG